MAGAGLLNGVDRQRPYCVHGKQIELILISHAVAWTENAESTSSDLETGPFRRIARGERLLRGYIYNFRVAGIPSDRGNSDWEFRATVPRRFERRPTLGYFESFRDRVRIPLSE